ncbi:hypothetical protein MPER_13107 [Moniliophthora perniciosa FA553]|nr:hypothetical protein MPER_13107 [Moniliophthora perniciosa FA553]
MVEAKTAPLRPVLAQIQVTPGAKWAPTVQRVLLATQVSGTTTSIALLPSLSFERQPYHPLIAINDHILQSKHEVNVVVTHDDVWIALLIDEVCSKLEIRVV